MADLLQCFFCKQLVEGYVEGLRRHIKSHVDRKDFDKNLIHYTCMKKGCRISYRKFSNLKQHIIKFHTLNPKHKKRGDFTVLEDKALDEDMAVDVGNQDDDDSRDPGENMNTGYSANLGSLRNFAAVSICKMASDVSFTEANIKKCMSFCESIVDHINQFVAERVARHLVSKLTSTEIVDLQNELCVTELFESVSTPKKQKIFLKNMVGSIPEPRTIMLHERETKRLVNGMDTIIKVKFFFNNYYSTSNSTFC